MGVQEGSRVTTSKQPFRCCMLPRLALHSRGLKFTRLSANVRHSCSSSSSCVTLCSTGKESRHNFKAALERLLAFKAYLAQQVPDFYPLISKSEALCFQLELMCHSLQYRKRVASQLRSSLGEAACFPGLPLHGVVPVCPSSPRCMAGA